MSNLVVRAVMVRGLGFLGFWVVLIGADPVDLAAGLATAAAAIWASLRLSPPDNRHLRYAALARLAWRFIRQSISGGVDVARCALDPRLPLRPGFVAYPARLPPGSTRNVFCAFTSAMPGTLPTGVDEHGALVYHCLDVEQPVAAQLAMDEALLTDALEGTNGDR